MTYHGYHPAHSTNVAKSVLTMSPLQITHNPPQRTCSDTTETQLQNGTRPFTSEPLEHTTLEHRVRLHEPVGEEQSCRHHHHAGRRKRNVGLRKSPSRKPRQSRTK